VAVDETTAEGSARKINEKKSDSMSESKWNLPRSDELWVRKSHTNIALTFPRAFTVEKADALGNVDRQ
jgi:hypothetical protein